MATSLTSTGVTFPDATMQTTAATAGVPSGVICMWSGTNANIPSGWNLCDGANSTPDLRNRFIVASGSTYATGNTGGADSVNSAGTVDASGLSAGATTLSTAQMPSHTHSITGYFVQRTDVINELVSGGGYPSANNSSAFSATSTSAGGGGSHSHSMSGSASFTGSSTENRPQYYALAYIMKS